MRKVSKLGKGMLSFRKQRVGVSYKGQRGPPALICSDKGAQWGGGRRSKSDRDAILILDKHPSSSFFPLFSIVLGRFTGLFPLPKNRKFPV